MLRSGIPDNYTYFIVTAWVGNYRKFPGDVPKCIAREVIHIAILL